MIRVIVRKRLYLDELSVCLKSLFDKLPSHPLLTLCIPFIKYVRPSFF